MGFLGENFSVDVKSSRGRRGKWKPKTSLSDESSIPELVIPGDGGVLIDSKKPTSKYATKKIASPPSRNNKPSGVSAKPTQKTTTKNETIPDSVTVTTSEIHQDVLEQALELLRGKPDKNWTKTPGPILKALRSAGFGVKVLSSGTPEKPGDMLELSQKHNSIDYTLGKRSTKEVAEILQGIIEQQERGRLIKAIEASSAQQSSKTSEPPAKVSETPIDSSEEGESEVDALQNDLASVENAGDDDVPVLIDAVEEKISLATPETLSDEALRDRAEKIAIMRAEILRREEDEGQAEGISGSVKTETEMPLVSVDTEKSREEAPPVAPERPRTFDARFESEFGITKEIWEQIPLHEKLSPAQQKLVFENLREFNERDNAPFLKHAWEGIMEKLGRKKDVGPTLDALSRLVESAAQYGPKVHEEAGELMIDFVGIEIPREHRMEWKKAFDSLNKVAHHLSKTPASWQEDGIGTHSAQESKMMSFIKDTLSPARKRYNEYQEIYSSYEEAKKELSRILGKAGYEPEVIAAKLVDIDKNVHMLQFQQTSPDAVEAIKDIPDTGMWKMIGKSLTDKSNLGWMALGAVGRTALAGAMGVFAAPTVSAAIAGGRSWDRTAAEMRERDRAARMGTRDTSKEALNIVSAEMTIDIAGEKREVGMTHKLQSLLDEYQKLSEEESEKGETQEYKKDMSKLIDRIKVRAQYVEDKQRLNRISYGSGETHAIQMAKLYETLALAQMIVADRHVSPKSALEERLGKILFQRENVLQDKRRTRQIKEASWNALRAGSFSAAGVWLAHEAQEMGLGEKLKEFLHTQNANGLSSLEMSFLSPEEVEGGISSYPEDAPMISQRPPYTIRSGDTLTKIMREQMPEIQALEARMSQNTAIAKILKGLSAEELQRIGIRSGNPDLIYAGETINTEALHKIVVSHQSVIDEVASRASGVAKTAHEAVGEKASGELLASKPLNVAPQTIEVPKVVSVEAGELGTVSKYEYRVGIPNAGEDPNLRLSILNEATQHTERWMKLYPYASARDAVKAGIMEGHFKNLFGEQWASAGKARVTDVLTHGSRFSVGNPDRMMSEFRALVETVEKPPMNVVPMPAENMKEYIERASMAYVLRGDAISENNLIRKIEMYYVKK